MGLTKPQKSHFWITSPVPRSWDCHPQQETSAKLPPSASDALQASALSQLSVQLLRAPESVGPCQPWGLHPIHPSSFQHRKPPFLEEATLSRWGEHITHLVHEGLVCVQYRGVIRQLIRASAVLPLKSIIRVLADCSLFGITDVSRVGERQQEAPERRICALAGVGE